MVICADKPCVLHSTVSCINWVSKSNESAWPSGCKEVHYWITRGIYSFILKDNELHSHYFQSSFYFFVSSLPTYSCSLVISHLLLLSCMKHCHLFFVFICKLLALHLFFLWLISENLHGLSGFPCLGVLLQKLENPALRACLKVKSNEVNLYLVIVSLCWEHIPKSINQSLASW